MADFVLLKVSIAFVHRDLLEIIVSFRQRDFNASAPIVIAVTMDIVTLVQEIVCVAEIIGE